MFHITIFAGTEAELTPRGSTALTLFGGTELRCPTLAAELLQLRAQRGRKPRRWAWLLGSDDNLVVTLFGASLLRMPTLIEEYQALTSVLQTGALTRDECRDLQNELTRHARTRAHQRAFTLFGACTHHPPSAGRERKAIAAAAQAGGLHESVRAALEHLVAAPPEVRARGLVDLATI